MTRIVALLILALTVVATAQDPQKVKAYNEAQATIDAVRKRVHIVRKSGGPGGVIFQVRIVAPEHSSVTNRSPSVAPFAGVLDVPCREIRFGLSARGPTGALDLQLPIEFVLSKTDGSIFTEFVLPQSHAGIAKGSGPPYIGIFCSGVRTSSGAELDWVSTNVIIDVTDAGTQPNK